MTSPDNPHYQRPRLLDLFCGAGGAALGYKRAGFHVTGVDIKPQPRYRGDEFYQADVLGLTTRDLQAFDVIHASPPCQHYSSAGKAASATFGHSYPDLYARTRAALRVVRVPWVIENVEGAPAMTWAVTLCGSMFGLDIQRHRTFESSELIMLDRHCSHAQDVITVTGHSPQRWQRGARRPVSVVERNEAMGIDWMTVAELVQAVPPAYTEWIGGQLIEYVTGVAGA